MCKSPPIGPNDIVITPDPIYGVLGNIELLRGLQEMGYCDSLKYTLRELEKTDFPKNLDLREEMDRATRFISKTKHIEDKYGNGACLNLDHEIVKTLITLGYISQDLISSSKARGTYLLNFEDPE